MARTRDGISDAETTLAAIERGMAAYRYPPGMPLPVHRIAQRLNTSDGVVRDACERLATAGRAIAAGGGEYLAWHQPERILAGDYDCSRALLSTAVQYSGIDGIARRAGLREIETIRRSLLEAELSHDELAELTGQIFLAIAVLTRNERAVEFVRWTNERMYFLRRVECRYLGGVASELLRLTDVIIAGRRRELRRAIVAYHDRRREFLPTLFRLLST